MAHSELPTRQNTVTSGGYGSDDESIPKGDPGTTLGLLEERLQAWKHMTGYLEDYMKAVAKDEKSQAKDSDKILKTINHPLKEGHHFDQATGGIAGLFENLRANTQAKANLHLETEKNITGSVLPILERLHAEVKNKRKELDKGAGKTSKAVDSARNTSQKHIELLGQHTATFDSAGGKTTAANDPYVLQRGVYHRLNKQIIEENNHRSDLIQVQNNFQQFEAHVINTLQSALNTFNQFMAAQNDREKAMYGDMAVTAQNISPEFEWNGFVHRNGNVLINPNATLRTIDQASFPNQNHRSTKALIEGSLERKPRGMGAISGYKSGYYAVTPAGYLHEYKDNDNLRHDPTPETSLYLRDCIIGAVDGVKFTIKGKDTSGNKLSQKMSISSEYAFKAHTPQDAAQWHSIISSQTSGASSSLPNSPVEGQAGIPANIDTKVAPAAGQQSAGYANTASPQSAGLAQTTPHQQSVPPQSAGTGGGLAANAYYPEQSTGIAQGAGHTPSVVPSQAAPSSAGVPPSYHTQPATNELEPRKY